MKRAAIIIAVLALAAVFSLQVSAAGEELEFYNMSIAQEFDNDNGVALALEEEIEAQAQAIAGINGISLQSETGLTGADESVKAVYVGGGDIGGVLDVLCTSQVSSAQTSVQAKHQLILENQSLEYIWKVPVYETDKDYIYAAVRINDGGEASVSSVIAPKGELNDVTYLFDRDLVPELIDGSGLNADTDAAAAVSISGISTDIIVFPADGQWYGIPFSARPEFLEVENGEIYELQELEEKISALTSEMSSGSGDNGAFDEGGGTGSMEEPEQPKSVPEYILVIAAVCVIAAGWTIYKKKRGGRRWDV